MSQPDLNPYRSSEVLAESTPPIEFEPIRPSFRAFLNAAIVLLIVAVLFWAVVTGFVIQSNDRAAHFISGLLHWLIASIGFGGCVALFPHLSPLRLARFRAGHYLAPFVGIVAASVPVFRLSMFSERTFLMFLTFILGASLVLVLGMLQPVMPWRWRITFFLCTAGFAIPTWAQLGRRMIPLSVLDVLLASVIVSGLLSYVVSLITELILWARSRSRHDWLHRLGLFLPLIYLAIAMVEGSSLDRVTMRF